MEAFNALVRAGYDLNRESSTRVTFVERLCKSKYISPAKMHALLDKRPRITPDIVSCYVLSRVETNSKRGN